MASAAVTDSAQLWDLTHEQRARVADVLAGISETDWATPSLCTGWSVKDVVAHMVSTHLMTPGKFIGGFVTAGFNFHKFSQRNVDSLADRTPQQLLQEYRDTMGRSTAPPGPKATWLAEAVIHGEDVARVVGASVPVAAPALITVADYTRRTKPLLHGKERSEGLTLTATDVSWSAGEGPEVRGPAAALIMAMAGRAPALDELSGDGLATLRQRAQ